MPNSHAPLLDYSARLSVVAQAMQEQREPAEVIDLILREALASLHADSGLFAAIKNDTVIPLCTVNTLVDADPISIHRDIPLAVAARERTAVWVSSREDSSKRFPDLGPSTLSNAAAWAVIPVITDDHVAAVLGLTFKTRRTFTKSDREFLQRLGDMAALALTEMSSERATEYAFGTERSPFPKVIQRTSLGRPHLAPVPNLGIASNQTPAPTQTTIQLAIDDSVGSDPETLAKRLRVFAEQFQRRLVSYNGNAGLSSLQFTLLARLEREGSLTYQQLAEAENITAVEVERALVVPIVVDELVEVGLLPDGSGVPGLNITRKGAGVVTRARRTREEWLATLLQTQLDETQRHALSDAITALERAF